MPRFDIPFSVNGNTQTITATGNTKIRAGSKNYWYAVFTFADDAFEGLAHLSAAFSFEPYSRNRGRVKVVPISENNDCLIPWEVLTKRQKIYVGVFAGDMLVTNEAVIEVTEAAPTVGDASQPTPAWYERFDAALAEKQDKLIAGENIEIEGNVISASGGGGGDSYWSANEDESISPTADIDMNNLGISNCSEVSFDDGAAALPFKIVTTAPTSETVGSRRDMVWCTADNHWYTCMGLNQDSYTWRKLVYADEAGTEDIFDITYGTTSMVDILSAYSAGKIVRCRTNSVTYLCVNAFDAGDYSYARFVATTSGNQIRVFDVTLDDEQNLNYDTPTAYNLQETRARVTSFDAFTSDSQYPSALLVKNQLALKQDITNLVTSLSAQSTDTQYPSAKCVYDLVGDIESLLAAI